MSIFNLMDCARYKEIKENEVKTAFVLNSSPAFKGYYYQGSDHAYHYFVGKWKFTSNNYFKIPINRLEVTKKHQFEFGDHELQLAYSNTHSEALFCQNGFYKLYILNSEIKK